LRKFIVKKKFIDAVIAEDLGEETYLVEYKIKGKRHIF